MKAVVAAFNQEKALLGAFSVITNLRMELFEALVTTLFSQTFNWQQQHRGVRCSLLPPRWFPWFTLCLCLPSPYPHPPMSQGQKSYPILTSKFNGQYSQYAEKAPSLQFVKYRSKTTSQSTSLCPHFKWREQEEVTCCLNFIWYINWKTIRDTGPILPVTTPTPAILLSITGLRSRLRKNCPGPHDTAELPRLKGKHLAFWLIGYISYVRVFSVCERHSRDDMRLFIHLYNWCADEKMYWKSEGFNQSQCQR